MTKFNIKEILSLSLDIGERMIKCGAEVSRVEKAVSIICESYGVKYTEVAIINSIMIATLRDDSDSVTESRRITYHDIDLKQLEEINTLSRNICKNNVSRKKVLEEIEKCRHKKNDILILFGGLIASSSFTLLFHGTLKDSIIAALISIIIFLLNEFKKKSKINNLLHSFFCSFIIGIISILLSKIKIVDNFDKTIIGDIMLLIPGLSMFVSINDIFNGDTMSGMGRFTEGLFLALSIAAGVGFSLLLIRGVVYA